MEKHLQPHEFTSQLTVTQLQHLSQCDFCHQRYIDAIASQELLTAPRDLKASVMEQLPPVLRWSPQKQFFHYCLRVGLALCGAFALLYLGPDLSPTLLARSQASISSKRLEYLSGQIEQATSQILKMEGIFYDKEKK